VTRTGYRLIDHTADFGAEIWAPDAEGLFRQAAGAMLDLLFDHLPDEGAGAHVRDLEIEGTDWADLMVGWLRELLFLVNGVQLVPVRLEILELRRHLLRAKVLCSDYDSGRHPIKIEIKAVTYHQIEAGPVGDRWKARVIFDV